MTAVLIGAAVIAAAVYVPLGVWLWLASRAHRRAGRGDDLMAVADATEVTPAELAERLRARADIRADLTVIRALDGAALSREIYR